jgi:hypothetical protein
VQDDPTEGALAGAQAKFVVFLASLLSRAGVASVSEFGALLATYADTVSETDPLQADLLADWAALVKQAAPH